MSIKTNTTSLQGLLERANNLPNAGGGGVTSWNDLTDKPFEETITTASALTWDGNTEGLFKYGNNFFKVSDLVITEDDLQNGPYVTLSNGTTYTSGDLSWSKSADGSISVEDFTGIGELVLISPADGSKYGQKGIYFRNDSEVYVTSFSISDYTFETSTVKTLDSKYLPEYLQLKDSKLNKEYLPACTWREVTNKPLGETYTPSDTLVWDGDIEGRESAVVDDMPAYKISDATPTLDDFVNGYIVSFPSYSMTEEDFPADEWRDRISLAEEYCFIATAEFTDDNNKICPRGTYFVKASRNDCVVSLTIPGYSGFEAVEINKLSPKYLPGLNTIAPIDLLDNSDFRKPVNQRDKTSYDYVYNVYSIDRWKLDYVNLTVENGYITLATVDDQGGIEQILEPGTLAYGKMYTLVVKLTTGELVICSGLLNDRYYNGGLSRSTDWGYIAVCYEESDVYPYVRIHLDKRNSNISIEWAALYEGEYTTETLPEYQPKGYGVELAECQRYYQTRSTNKISAKDMRPLMRLTNPTISTVTGGYAYSADL